MTKSNVWILGASGNIGRELAKLIDNEKHEIVSTLYLIDRVEFPFASSLVNCHTRILTTDVSDGDFIAPLNPSFDVPQIFINLIAKDYPVNSDGLTTESSHPFSLTTSEYVSSFSVSAGTSYNLIKLIIEKNVSPAHLVLIGSIYNSMLPDPLFYSFDKSLYKPVAYSSAKHAQRALMQQAAVYLAKLNSRCNSIAYGGIDLDQSEYFKRAYAARSPQSSLVPLKDALDALIWLAFDSPSSMNGAELLLDSGISLT